MDALYLLCVPLTHDLFAIAKFLLDIIMHLMNYQSRDDVLYKKLILLFC